MKTTANILMKTIAMAALGVGLLSAQPAPARNFTPNFDGLKAYLGLSDTQLASIQQIQQTARTDARAIEKSIMEKMKALRDLRKSGSTDAAAIGQLTVDIDNLRKQLEPIRTREHDQALTVLTPDQKTKLAALDAAAKLAPEIRQAMGLGLLTPATPTGGTGPGLTGVRPRARFRGRP